MSIAHMEQCNCHVNHTSPHMPAWVGVVGVYKGNVTIDFFFFQFLTLRNTDVSEISAFKQKINNGPFH